MICEAPEEADQQKDHEDQDVEKYLLDYCQDFGIVSEADEL